MSLPRQSDVTSLLGYIQSKIQFAPAVEQGIWNMELTEGCDPVEV